MRAALVLLALLALPAAVPATAQTDPVAAGDAAWERRAEGRQGDHAAPGPIGQAVAAYERAVKERPDRLEAHWKLLRALYYQGEFAVRDKEGKQRVFARGREVVEAALDQVGRRVGGRKKLDDLPPQQAAKLLSQTAGIPDAPAIFLYGGIHWGLWGDVYGRLAAARQGVGDKVRRYGEVALALDERFQEAGARRLLGRLHTLAPKVPLVTGWVDRGQAVSHLRRAVALFPGNLYNQVYLADALLQHQPDKAAEAREILRRALRSKPDPAELVEDERALAEARALLGGR